MSDFFVHESSYIGENAEIGVGTKIWQFCNIMDGAIIGSNCNIGQNVLLKPEPLSGTTSRSKTKLLCIKA